jgi:hypothetical protein
MSHVFGAALVLMLGASSALAQATIPLRIRDRSAFGMVTLPGASAELHLRFERVAGLDAGALHASARLVDPRDPALAARLPPGGLVTLPGSFPVLLRVSPPPRSALAFTGVVHVALHTPNLHLDRATPLALFRAQDGGPFEDVAEAEAAGSYRVCGSGGGFSEFVIAVDRRPAAAQAAAKLASLEASVAAYRAAMPPAVTAELLRRLAAVRARVEAGDLAGASESARLFERYVREHSGADIPDLWRAHDPGRVNVAGTLRSQAKTLRFSLRRAQE